MVLSTYDPPGVVSVVTCSTTRPCWLLTRWCSTRWARMARFVVSPGARARNHRLSQPSVSFSDLRSADPGCTIEGWADAVSATNNSSTKMAIAIGVRISTKNGAHASLCHTHAARRLNCAGELCANLASGRYRLGRHSGTALAGQLAQCHVG